MTATLKIAMTGFAFALASALFAQSAEAKRVSIGGTHSAAEIKATCANVGGEYIEQGSTYGCEKPDKGTSVYCNDGKCHGYVPDKPAGGGTTRAPAAEEIFGLPLQ
jgi:hypothetical protein